MLSLFLAGDVGGQIPCPADLTKVPGRVVVTPPQLTDPVALKNIRQATMLLEQSVKGFTGGEVRIYTSDFEKTDTSAGKYKMYEVAMYFLKYECVGGIVKPEAATGLWIYFSFYRIPFFNSNNDVGYTLNNGQEMYYSRYALGDSYKGLPTLGPLHHPNGKAVWVSEQARLPLRSVTRAEVLPAYREAFFKNRDETVKRLEASLSTEQRDLGRIDSSPNSLADKERSRKALLDSNVNSRSFIEKAKAELSACTAEINDALSKPTAKDPAFVEFVDSYCKPEKMFIDRANPRAKAITAFDDAFFDRTKPASVAQFIVIYWRPDASDRFPIKRDFSLRFEEGFDFNAARAMLGK